MPIDQLLLFNPCLYYVDALTQNPSMSPDEINWNLLANLRDIFLANKAAPDYWENDEILKAYDLTFAARIGWKLDKAFLECASRGWKPTIETTLLDWGSGTGIAARRFLTQWKWPGLKKVLIYDQSERACKYAIKKITDENSISVELWDGSRPQDPFILTASHLLNELSKPTELLQLASFAHSVFFVEPGTPTLSKKLIEIREEFRDSFKIVAPCPHASVCGLLSADKDWCHQFAEPAPEVFTTKFWRTFSEKLKIDLRSLPVSYLALTKSEVGLTQPEAQEIGRPRIYKGYAAVMNCREKGISDEKILKSKQPELYKRLKKF
jgi:hypothetical protein